MFDIIAVITNLGLIGYFAYTLLTSGGDFTTLTSNYIFLGYIVFTVLTLPMLISKSIFKKKIIGLTTAYGYLIYLIEYLIGWSISQIFNIDISEILLITGYINIALWNILFIIFLFSDEKTGDKSEDEIKEILLGFIPAILYTVVFIYLRQPNSVVALDYLQHLTVPNKIASDGLLCILPGQCSNLFLQHGYTTIYHSILGFMTTFINVDIYKIFYVIDIVFPFIVSIPLFTLYKRNIGNKYWAIIGVLLTLFTFVMGAYDFIFFIPQTFALLLFLMIYQEKNLTPFKLILGTILLISSHFIIGTYLAVMIWIKFFTVSIFNTKKYKTLAVLILLTTAIFFIIANMSGFSVEKMLQLDSVFVIGGLTNPYYPNNIFAYFSVLGPVNILLITSIIYFIFQKEKGNASYLAIEYILLSTTAYFMAPTYANKFLIATGVFATILILKMINDLNFKKLTVFLISIFIIPTFLLTYISNYKTYLRFYTQNTGTTSAIVEKDKNIVKFLKDNDVSEVIISDPYTQISIASLANIDTANAQYMNLKSRTVFYNFLANPNDNTWEQLLLIDELKNHSSFKILYTSRLEESLKEENLSWLFNIYSLLINNNYEIEEQPEFIKYLESKGNGTILFKNSNFILVNAY